MGESRENFGERAKGIHKRSINLVIKLGVYPLPFPSSLPTLVPIINLNLLKDFVLEESTSSLRLQTSSLKKSTINKAIGGKYSRG